MIQKNRILLKKTILKQFFVKLKKILFNAFAVTTRGARGILFIRP